MSALELDASEKALIDLGKVLFYQGAYEKSKIVFASVIKQNPHCGVSEALLVLTLLAQGEPQLAENICKKRLSLTGGSFNDSRPSFWTVALSFCRLHCGDIENATATFSSEHIARPMKPVTVGEISK